MGNSFFSSNKEENPILKASLFWENPSIKRLSDCHSSNRRYNVGLMYRGKRSIITEEELWAARKIIRAYKSFKARKANKAANQEGNSD